MPYFDEELLSLAQEVGRFLTETGRHLATAESCTGGWIGAALTAVPGSSAWYEGGVISYANAAKTKLLGVPTELLQSHGAVSEPVAIAMANGARDALGVELAIAVTGIAGPGGGSDSKPVGTVCIAWAGPGWQRVRTYRFDGDRDEIRRQSVIVALNGVLQGNGQGGGTLA